MRTGYLNVMKNHYPLQRLIENRTNNLGIDRGELLRRMGYTNLVKGYRRLAEFESGNFKHAKQLRNMLASGLDLPVTEVDHEITQTWQQISDELDAEYRMKFHPHAIILTERTIPSPIFVAALMGVDRLLRIDFKKGSSPITYARLARKKLPEDVPAFGKTTGFVVNYAPDRAVEFDLDATCVRHLETAAKIGCARIRFNR